MFIGMAVPFVKGGKASMAAGAAPRNLLRDRLGALGKLLLANLREF
jgi:hypothetical protein